MAQQLLKVEVLSPEKPLAKVDAVSVLLPGAYGYMEILPRHAPLISELDCGHLKLTTTGNESSDFFIAGGYVEVTNNIVRVLVDVGESVQDIDSARAEAALVRASKLLSKHQVDVDLARAHYAKKRAEERLALVKLIAAHSGRSH